MKKQIINFFIKLKNAIVKVLSDHPFLFSFLVFVLLTYFFEHLGETGILTELQVRTTYIVDLLVCTFVLPHITLYFIQGTNPWKSFLRMFNQKD